MKKNTIAGFNYIKKNKVSANTPLASMQVAKNLIDILVKNKIAKNELIVLCIGTDRSTGDSLGPLVGSRLVNLLPSQVKVYGNLVKPVHAVNLDEKINYINKSYHTPYIIAVDACLGKSSSVGKVTIEEGPLKPGTGVNKALPLVGNCHVTGTVNVGGFMEYLVLQNTRLSVVIQLSIIISKGIILAVNYLHSDKTVKK